MISKALDEFAWLSQTSRPACTLVLSHPDISPDITNQGLSIMAKDNFMQLTHD
jgi:hypothetical protein